MIHEFIYLGFARFIYDDLIFFPLCDLNREQQKEELCCAIMFINGH